MNYTSPKKTIDLIRVRVSLAAILLVSVFVYLCLSVSYFFAIGIGVVALVWFAALWYYIPAFVGSFSLFVSEKGIVMRRGVFLKTERIMPEARLVFVQSNTTPLSRAMGLCSLSFLAAKARVTTLELGKKDAEEITDFIRRISK